MRVSYEELDSGMQVVLLGAPHFQTTSARLGFYSGALHQTPDMPPGVAHFLEHTPFQGTRDLPSLEAVNDYAEADGTDHNAWTDQTTTTYEADGVNAARVLNLVFQLGFHPLLTKKGLEEDRNAVIEEAREYQYDPYRPENENYYRQFGGDRYAELVTGNVGDVKKIRRRHIIDFYRQNYQVGNSFLVVCSSQPFKKLDRTINALVDDIDQGRTVSDPEPFAFDLPWLEYPEPVTTFHNVKDDDDTQSDISIGYWLEAAPDFRGHVLQQLGGMLLGRVLHHTLREELNLVYGATAEVTSLENSSHGQEEVYVALEIETSLIGSSAIQALDAIERVEGSIDRHNKFADFILKSRVRKLKKAAEADAEAMADAALISPQLAYDQTYDPKAELEIVRGFTTDDVAREAAKMVADRRLTNIAGPNKRLLRKAAAHASR